MQRNRFERLVDWLEDRYGDYIGRAVEWFIVIAFVAMVASVAYVFHDYDGDLDVSAKVVEEQHRKAIAK